ncbi:hypothetical protein BFC19_08375 [Brochothrix thermosphacta]|nr:hypothetical protein BFC19_08375 [Brochothrix thermosphacta]
MKKGVRANEKNKLLLVLMSGVLTFTAMPSVYASNSSETLTSEKSKTIQNNSSSLSESALNDSEQTETDTNTANSENTSSAISDDDTTVNTSDNETITSESSNETTEKSSSEEKTPQEKAVEETLANLPKMELRPDLGPGYYQVESESKTRSKRSLAAPTMSNTELFLSQIKAGAISGWKKYKVLPSLTGAQAALESGWGSSGLSLSANNLFGIKGRYNGQFELWPTLEFINGQWVTVNAEFRKYPSWKESMEDHGKFLVENPRYYKVLGEKDYIKATNEIWLAGYATDPDYPGKLQRTITYNNLTVWDAEAFNDNVDLTKYYTENPGTIVMKKDDYQYNGVEFNSGTKGKLNKKGTVLKVKGISYSANGTPRLQLSNNAFITAHKSNVLKTTSNINKFYTDNPGKIVMKIDDYAFSGAEFDDKTRGKLYKKGAILNVQGIEYSAAGTPHLLLTNNTYVTANKTKVQKVTSNITNFYTGNPQKIVMKIDDYAFSSAEFNDKTQGKTYKKGAVLNVKGIEYSSAGTPRLLLTNNLYVTANKAKVQKVTSNIANFYTTNPGKIVMKINDYAFKSAEFNDKTQDKTYKKGTILNVKGIEYSAAGTPRLLLTNNLYVTANKAKVQKVTSNIANFHTTNPGKIVMKINDYSFKSAEFNDKTQDKTYKKGTILNVKGIEYSAAGTPRLLLTNNLFVTANKAKVQKVTSNIANFYTENPKKIVMKIDDYAFKSAEFNDKTQGKTYKKGTVLNVKGIEYSAAGTPRLLLTNNLYVTANKAKVQHTIANVAQYYTVDPGTVILKRDEYQHNSVSFTQATKGKLHKKGSSLKTKGIAFTKTGYPRLILNDGNYLTANKDYVEKK